MFNDIIIFALSLWGIISLLFTFVLKMIVWRIGGIIITIPLFREDKEIFNKIYCIRSLFEFCGIEKKCTVVVVNYNAPEILCNEIKSFYSNYTFVKLVNPDELEDTLKELHT